MEKMKWTAMGSCVGCGAKVGAGILSSLLKELPVKKDENLLVGFDTVDDAAVYRVTDEVALVQTVDFFPPMVEDPYLFGQIAAANALSDVYAMGGSPKTAMNLLCIPKDTDPETVRAILQGGCEKVAEAGAVIAGGHSIYDDTVKYGLSVTGFADPSEFLRNNTPRPGDVLFLTKPLGVGILLAANTGGLLADGVKKKLFSQMTALNRSAAEAAKDFSIHSCTDVTGFGLAGHLTEMCSHRVTAVLSMDRLPLIDPCVTEFAAMGLLPEGLHRNRRHAAPGVAGEEHHPLCLCDVLYDPQTSGGLLLAVDAAEADDFARVLAQAAPGSCAIGTVTPYDGAVIRLQ